MSPSIAELQVANALLRSAVTDIAQAFALSQPVDAAEALEQLAAQCRTRASYILGRVPPETSCGQVVEEIIDQINDALWDVRARLQRVAA